MAVSKRLRYEVLRRDNHACRYCGAAAPDAKLTVDHVIPTALGGSDDPSNLVSACIDCNAGKSSSTPDAPLVAEVSDEAIKWGQAVRTAASAMVADLESVVQTRREFLDAWNSWGYGPENDRHHVPIDTNWPESLGSLMARGLPMEIIRECIGIAMRRRNISLDNVFRYFCGVAWRKVEELTDRANSVSQATNTDVVNPFSDIDPIVIFESMLDAAMEAIVDAHQRLSKAYGRNFGQESAEAFERSGITTADMHEFDQHALALAVEHVVTTMGVPSGA